MKSKIKMKKCRFLKYSVFIVVLFIFIEKAEIGLANTAGNVVHRFETRNLKTEPRKHFFGCYSISPRNKSAIHLLSLVSFFQGCILNVNEPASIDIIDVKIDKFEKVIETHVCNQNGAPDCYISSIWAGDFSIFRVFLNNVGITIFSIGWKILMENSNKTTSRVESL